MELRKIVIDIPTYRFEELDAAFQQLIEAAKTNTKNAYAPYSQFCVGAAVLLQNGVVVSGSNQENAAYPSGICAERTAMFYANSTYPIIAPVALAIAAFTDGDFLEEPISPCGSCRQVLLESEKRYGKEIPVLLYGKNAIYLVRSVKELLPLAFDEKSLKK